MKRSDIYGGDWMKATRTGTIGIPGEPSTWTGTIKKMSMTEFDDGKKQAVIHWTESDIPDLGLNGTNWDTIAHYSGKDNDDDWVGVSVECFVVPEPKSRTGYAIRVRRPSPSNGNGNFPAAVTTEVGAKKALAAAFPKDQPDDLKTKWVKALFRARPDKDTKDFVPEDWKAVAEEIEALALPF